GRSSMPESTIAAAAKICSDAAASQRSWTRTLVLLWIQERRVAYLHVDQTLRDVDLIVRLQNHVLFRVSFFNDALEIDRKILAIFLRHFHFTLVCEITKTARANDCLADRVAFIRGNLLRPLASDRAVNVNLSA